MNKIKPEIPELTTAKWQRIISSAIESSTNAIVISDLNGSLTYVNNSFLKMWGFDDDKEVRGRRLVEFWQVKDQALKILGALRESDSWEGELAAKRKDGSNFEVDLSINIVTDEAGNSLGMIGTFRDITKHRKVEEALHESEDKYRRFLENLADGCFAIDRNWRYVFVNDAACQFVKYTRSELLGNKITKLFPGIEDTPFFQAYKNTMGTGKTNDIEAPFPRPDGTPGHFSIRVSAVPEGIVVIAHDITERKLAEEELRESESKYRSLIENIKDIVFTIDPGGKITFMSKSSEEILGYKSEEMSNKNIFDFVSAEDRQRITETIIRGMKGEKITQFQTTAITKSGNRIFVEVTVSRIWEEGVVFGALAIARDITERKRAEEQLRLLSSAVEQSSEGIAVVDLEGNLLFVNNAFAAMHGYDPEELVGKQLSIFHTPEQMPSVEAANRQIQETGKFSGEIWHIRSDGTGFPGLMQNSLLRDEAGNPIGMIGTLREITDLKRAEEELRESEDQYRSLFNATPVGIGIADLEGNIIAGNQAMTEMTGFTLEELKDVNIRDTYVDPHERKHLLGVLQEHGRVRDFEVRLKRKDGTTYFALLNVDIQELAGEKVLFTTTRDITETKRMEESLRENESQYRLLAENVIDVIWTIDMNLRHTYLSPSIEHLRGYTAEETMSETLEEMMTPASFETAMRAFEEEMALEKGGKQALLKERTLELELKCKDGSTVWIEAKVSSLRDHNGQLIGFLGVSRDITERKKAETELLQAQKQRLASIGQLAAGVAHEINNPLMALSGEIQLLLLNGKDKELVESLELMHKLSKRIAGIVTDLVTFSREISTDVRELSDINSLIERTLSLMEGRLKSKNVEVKKKLGKNLPNLIVDKGQIQQVFMNILMNSLDAMSAGGELTISTKLSRTKNTIDILFVDTGSGIAEENLPKIFDPFFTTKPPGKGVGMGLSVSYRIIENHSGSIKIDSKLNEGTKVSISLPITETKS